MFQGAAQLILDNKGRLAIPTRHRERLQSGDSSELVLTAHPHGCALMFPSSVWAPIRDEISNLSGLDANTALWKRCFLGFAEDVTPDSTGRVLLSPELRRYAAIDRNVMMVGQGSHFEIWSMDKWEEQLSRLGQPSVTVPPEMAKLKL